MKIRLLGKIYNTRPNANRPRIFIKKIATNKIEYLELTRNKSLTKPGSKIYSIIKGIKYWIKEIFVTTGTMIATTVNYANSSSSGGWSPWTGAISSIKSFGFIKNLTIRITCTCTYGNFDYMGTEVIVYNAKNKSKQIRKSYQWGHGNNWVGSFTTNIQLNQNELNILGGQDTEILVKQRAYINRGSHGAGVRSEVKIITT